MRGRERRGGVAGPDRRPLPLHQQAFSTAGCTTARKPPVFFHSINTISAAGSGCHIGNEARTGWSSGFCYYLANSFVRHVTDGKCKKKAPRKIHKSKRQKHKRVLLNDLLGELIKMLRELNSHPTLPGSPAPCYIFMVTAPRNGYKMKRRTRKGMSGISFFVDLFNEFSTLGCIVKKEFDDATRARIKSRL
ncbi:uncharacterized protein LOC119314809 isoform X2 [Triticum dicoccoides]|uniref:uncharacterized protein LOC119314809 isoform X2 n=1 Tax=Triticum dicoccoides TaxID=85692 RepID=UPI0018914B1C|nr:uncharacterized protein LOC119314809 isoform X2 [Triticum dicoccoides]